jgi:peptide/nickel transport system ATP-binding protein
MSEPLLELEDLKKYFPTRTGLVAQLLNRGEQEYVRAVDGVSLELERGEAFGLAGESGCWKVYPRKNSASSPRPDGRAD